MICIAQRFGILCVLLGDRGKLVDIDMHQRMVLSFNCNIEI